MEFDLRDIPTREALQELSKKVPEVDIAAVETLLLFFRTSSNVFRVVHEHMARFGISQGKFSLLLLLYRNMERGLLPSELADSIGVTRATVTGLLDGLERDGLVERVKHPKDRRMHIIKLTNKGLHILKKLLPDHFVLTSKLMNTLSTHEKEQFITLLQKIEEGIPFAK